VEPDIGKVGDMISAKGENLDKSSIGELYLTDGAHDLKMQITEQNETEVKFKVPLNTKARRYHLMVLTFDKKSIVEQPVVFTVE